MSVSIDLRIDHEGWGSVADMDALCQLAIVGALEHVGKDSPSHIDILLTGDEKLAELNSDWRGKSGPTDVLSFPADPEEQPFIGDIAVAFGVAQKDSAASGKSLGAHLTHLLIHGTLHLLGHDHETEEEAKIMETLERDVMEKLGYEDPYSRIEQG